MTIVQTSVCRLLVVEDQAPVAVGIVSSASSTTQSIVEAVPPSIWLSTVTVTLVSGVLLKLTVSPA